MMAGGLKVSLWPQESFYRGYEHHSLPTLSTNSPEAFPIKAMQ